MIDTTILPAFLVAVVIISIVPGVDMAYVVASAIDHGPRAGLLSALGMSLGMAVHTAGAALGIAALLQARPGLLDALRAAGAAYLLYLSIATLRSVRTAGLEMRLAPNRHRLVGRAVLTNIANPKILLFFAAFLPQFVRPGQGSPALQIAILGLIFLTVGLIIDAFVGLAAGRVRQAMPPGSATARRASIVSGVTFAALAVLIVADIAKGR